MAAARRYQMTRVRAGDYLLPSNDAATLWRFTKSTDGWEAWSRVMFASDAELDAWDVDDFASFDHHGTYDSRQAAIDYALRTQAPLVREYEIVDGFLRPKW